MNLEEYNKELKELQESSVDYLHDQAEHIKSMLSYGLDLPPEEIKINFPKLNNFYYSNKVYKSSWAIYIHRNKMPKLLYTGNFLIQGGPFTKRSNKSPFGAKALNSLISVANTFSYDASYFKQNWTLDLNLFEEGAGKLNFTVKDYQEFLRQLNIFRGMWLLHLSEEGSYDFVISEFSEPSDPVFFIDLDNFDSSATKVKTYFKLISEEAFNLFKNLSSGTEFEGKFHNLQPGMWIKDDVIIEMENLFEERFFGEQKPDIINNPQAEIEFKNPFRIQALRPSY